MAGVTAFLWTENCGVLWLMWLPAGWCRDYCDVKQNLERFGRGCIAAVGITVVKFFLLGLLCNCRLMWFWTTPQPQYWSVVSETTSLVLMPESKCSVEWIMLSALFNHKLSCIVSLLTFIVTIKVILRMISDWVIL